MTKAQSEYEKKWAQAFLDYINSHNKSDYITADHDNSQTPKWVDIDVKAISPTKKFLTLYLQLTTDNRFDDVIKNGKYRTPVFNSDNVWEAISDKEKKYLKNGKDFSEITLLIQGTMTQSSIPFELTESLYNQCANSNFKQIYYLSAPALVGSKGVNHFEGWFIAKLK